MAHPNGKKAELDDQPPVQFEVLKETTVYDRYVSVLNRVVQFPPRTHGERTSAPVVEFDVVGHPRTAFHSSVTLPLHLDPSGRLDDCEVTLLREYAQGINQLAYCLPSGAFDPPKHGDFMTCAKAELSEEAHLKGGCWTSLLPEGHPGMAEVKWGANRYTPFLCIDPQPDESPAPRDEEEFIEVLRIRVRELRRLLLTGQLLTPSTVTCFLAFDYLAKEGIVTRD